MSQEVIENKINELIREIEEKEKIIKEFKSIREKSKGVLEKFQDLYRDIILKIEEIILNYSKLRYYTRDSHYDEICEYKEKEVNYNEKFISISEKLYGVKNVYFSIYLNLNNLLVGSLKEKRNQVVHHYPNKKLNLSDFLEKTTPSIYKKMFKNLNKATENVRANLRELNDNIDNYKEFQDYYEILGDIYVHRALLHREYSQNDFKKYIIEAKNALSYYNKAIDCGRKLKNKGISYISYRANNYMEIFNNFFFKDKLGNLKKITDLKEKRDYIEEKFRIWEKLTHKRFDTSPLKGMKDFFPADMREVNWIIDKIRNIADLYSYEEYEGPVLEPIEIFAAKSSHELVYEQSFFVEKFEDRKMILSPELTPTLARMVARKYQELKKPIRWYSTITCFRYEQPQKGRLRSFKQVNFDILGEIGLLEEIEIFNISVDIFTSFGATSDQFQIYYNNRRLIDAIFKFILKIPDNIYMKVYKALDKSDKMEDEEYQNYLTDTFNDDKLVKNILQLNEINDIENLPYDNIPNEFYNSQGYKEIKQLQKLLKETNLEEYCTFSASVVRGLDYYTGTVYEVYDMGEENRRSIFGGGRYDDLLNLFSNEQISGIGFGMGLLSFKLFLRTYNLIPENVKELDYSNIIYITSFNEKLAPLSIKLSQKLRKMGFECLIDYSCGKLGNQISKANKLNCKAIAIIGPQEQEEKYVTFKNLLTNTQKTFKLKNLNRNILEDILEK